MSPTLSRCWTRELDSELDISTQLFEWQGRLAVVSGQSVRLVDPADGRIVWETGFDQELRASLIGDELRATTQAGDLVSLDPAGKVTWRQRIEGELFAAPAALPGGGVVVGSRGDSAGSVVAAFHDDGSMAWTTRIDDWVLISPLVVSPWLVLASSNGLQLLDPATGAVLEGERKPPHRVERLACYRGQLLVQASNLVRVSLPQLDIVETLIQPMHHASSWAIYGGRLVYPAAEQERADETQIPVLGEIGLRARVYDLERRVRVQDWPADDVFSLPVPLDARHWARLEGGGGNEVRIAVIDTATWEKCGEASLGIEEWAPAFLLRVGGVLCVGRGKRIHGFACVD